MRKVLVAWTRSRLKRSPRLWTARLSKSGKMPSTFSATTTFASRRKRRGSRSKSWSSGSNRGHRSSRFKPPSRRSSIIYGSSSPTSWRSKGQTVSSKAGPKSPPGASSSPPIPRPRESAHWTFGGERRSPRSAKSLRAVEGVGFEGGRFAIHSSALRFDLQRAMPVSAPNSQIIYDALKGLGIRLLSVLPETWLVHLVTLADEDTAMMLVRLGKEEEGGWISVVGASLTERARAEPG